MAMVLEGKSYLTAPIEWARSEDAEYPYEAEHEGHKLLVRLNDFPEAELYALIADGEEITNFDDWPNSWARPSVSEATLNLHVPQHLMTPESGITMMCEYDTLRNELLEAKRHVFERPLIIAALAAAGLQFLDKPFALVLPSVVALLTIFNFWFTLNRVQSANRIVAYIQLVLEPSAKLPWIGWESSLRRYRRWLRANPDARTFIDAQLDQTAVPDALMYYPALYYFHFALMISAMLASGGLLIQQPNRWRFVFFLPTLLLAGQSMKYFTRWKPSRLRASIERNRVIWQNVLGEDRIESWRQTAQVTTTTLKQMVDNLAPETKRVDSRLDIK